MMIPNTVVFDIETPNAHNDRICSIGIATIEDGVITQSFSYLVNPEADFDDANISIHGISPDMVRGADIFPEIWENISYLFEQCHVAGHNVIFDLSVLKKTLCHYGISADPIKYFCTMHIAKAVCPNMENYRLGTLCNAFNIPLTAHKSESDSMAAAKLLLAFAEKCDSIQSFERLYCFSEEPSHNHATRTPRSISPYGLTDFLGTLSDASDFSPQDIKGKNICLSGDFQAGTKVEVQIYIEDMGGIMQKNVTSKTDYLIVGELGSPTWVAGIYGNKIKKALGLQAKGKQIKILREKDFFASAKDNGRGV